MAKNKRPSLTKTYFYIYVLISIVIYVPSIGAESVEDRLPVRSVVKITSPRVSSNKPDQIRKQKPGFIVESDAISFEGAVAGKDFDLPGCIAIRVYSDTEWELKLYPPPRLQIVDHVDAVPISRLKIKSLSTANYIQLQEGIPVVIASGGPTSPAGKLIIAGLRLRLEDADQTGRYLTNLTISLESK